MTLEQFVAKRMGWSVRTARVEILSGAVTLAGSGRVGPGDRIDRFAEIRWRERVLRPRTPRIHLALHKPRGVVSATSDERLPTVLDLIDLPESDGLHLAGRLDRSSTGLVLLTNDGTWSEAVTRPQRSLAKHYLVETDRPIPLEAVSHFRTGFDFEPEGIRTRPAGLEILSPHRAHVILREGRYHQIKRMFHRLDGVRLVSLHRFRIGPIRLDPSLEPGQWRRLTGKEIESIPREPEEEAQEA